MRTFRLYIVIFVVVFVAWGSLFATTLNQDARLNKVAAQNEALAAQNALIVKQLQANIAKASAARSAQLQTILQDMQCIADFFNQTNRTNLTLSNLQSCTIISTSGGSAGSTKSD